MKIVYKKINKANKGSTSAGIKSVIESLQESLSEVDKKLEQYLNHKPSIDENFKTRTRNHRPPKSWII